MPSTKPTARLDPIRLQGTNATIELSEKELTLSCFDRGPASCAVPVARREIGEAVGVLEILDPGKIEEASQGAARQKVSLKAGISQESVSR